MELYLIDAFTNAAFKGNPAGVVICDNDFPSEEWMQGIAAEFNASNTAFLKKLGENHYHIRWFTVTSEAPLCGHATVAAMHAFNKYGHIDASKPVVFESMSGELKGYVEGDWYKLDFPAFPPKEVEFLKDFEDVIHLSPIYVGHARNCYVMEFENLADLKLLSPNLERLKQIDCRALIATSKGEDYDFHVRYFAPRVGIPEDPVCVSAHCVVIPYWANKLGKNNLISQMASKRTGILKCEYLQNRVLISGEAVTIYKADVLV